MIFIFIFAERAELVLTWGGGTIPGIEIINGTMKVSGTVASRSELYSIHRKEE